MDLMAFFIVEGSYFYFFIEAFLCLVVLARK